MSGIANRALPPLPPGEKERPPVDRQVPVVEQVVDFLLPTGILISIQVSQTNTLRQLKQELFREAKGYPLYSLLKDQGFYNFLGISRDGEKEEYVNESRELGDLDLFAPVLKLVERQGNQEKLLTAEISNLIGRRLHDFDIMGAEVQDFRQNCLSMCEEAVNERNSSDRTIVLYNHPPTLLASGDDEIDGIELIEVDTFHTSSDRKQTKVPLKVDLGSCPSEVVERATFSGPLNHVLGRGSPQDWVLKVVGREEYLLKEKRFSSYKYVRDSIAKEKRAQFSLKRFEELVPKEKDVFVPPVFSQVKLAKTKSLRGNPKDSIATWDVMDTYKVKVVSAKNVNVAENQKVYVRAGIYHGSEPVCSSVTTSQGANPDGGEWNEILEFNAPVGELPRAAKVCFVIFGATESVMKKKITL